MPYIRDSTALLADGKIHKLADAWFFLDLPDCGSDCGDNQARPTVIDSRSILAGVQGFESLSPHSLISLLFQTSRIPPALAAGKR